MKRRYCTTYAVQKRATRHAQDDADDKFYAEQARKRREAEEAAAKARADDQASSAEKGGDQ